MADRAKRFSKANPVHGQTGASRFTLNDNVRFKVGFWREEWKAPDVYEMKTLYHNLTEAAKARQIERAEIAKKRSAEGKMVIRERDERIARERARAVLADAKRAREVAEQAIERAAERRAGLELSAAKISSSDYAGALRRERIRTKLEAMDPKSQREALAHLHPDVVAALAEMPLQFSPVSPDIYMTTLERAFEKEHGETLAELEAIEQAAEVTLQAAKGGEVIAKESLADNLMLAPQEVDAVASEIMGG